MEDDVHYGQVRLVGKISLWFSLVATLGLAVVVLLAGSPQVGYLDNVQSLTMTHRQLPLVMLVGGLGLAAGTGMTTWLITLHSSFRVAGPLYRFSRNLETGIETGRVPRIRIRGTDYLHPECEALEQTAMALEGYRGELDRQVERALLILADAHIDDSTLQRRLEQLKMAHGRARCGD